MPQNVFNWNGNETYHHGMSPIGMKNPLVNPMIAARGGERRMAIFGNVMMSHMSSPTHAWLRATFTTTS